jgi:acetolactate synthase-1/3 small subunit
MTIVVAGDDRVLEQITKQLNKMIDTLKVFDLPADIILERELVLVKVKALSSNREEITQLAKLEEAKIVDVADSSLTLEMSGPSAKVEGFIKLLQKFGIMEMVRTGRIALGRGKRDS